MPFASPLTESRPLDVESRYTLLEKVGSGTFATVYRARDNELGREVAVKQIHDQYMADPQALDRFWAEAQLLASLQHPNIVTIYDLHKDRGWIVMELMQTNLADRMQGKPLSVQAAKSTVAHCLRALKYLHERGITHGDVKPSNMMIDHRKRVKIGDFGLARRVSDDEGSLLKGTTRYMAPEVVSDEFGEIGPPSDLYSLGFSTYSLLCGENFEQLFPGLSAFGRNKQIAWMMWHAAPDRRIPEIGRVLQGVPEDLAAVVDKLVQKKQSERYTSAGAALDDLGVDQKIVKEVKEGGETKEADPEEAARKKRLLLLGGAMAFSVVLSLFILLKPSGNEGPAPSDPSVVVFEEFLDSAEGEKTIKISYVDRPGAKEMSFADDPEVLLREFGENEQYVLLRELVAGDRLELDRSDGRLRIVASRPVETEGRIVELRPGDRRIVVAPVRGRWRNDIELRVTENTEITRNGRPAELTDVEEGKLVRVWHLPELKDKPGRIASRLEVTAAEEKVGFLEAYDADAGTVAISVMGRDSPLVLSLAKDATLSLSDRGSTADVRPSELRRNDRVRILHDSSIRSLEAIRDDREITGVVVEADAGSGTLEVKVAGGRTSVRVPAEADVAIGAGRAKLGDLRENDDVRITLHDARGGGAPTASSVTARRWERGNRWAVVVATAAYQAELPELPYLVADARRLGESLTERYLPDDRLIEHVDLTGQRLEREFGRSVGKVGPGAELVVYLGGHVLLGNDGKAYFGGTDFDPREPSSRGVPLDVLVDTLDRSAAKSVLLLLDTCHAGLEEGLEPASSVVAEKAGATSKVSILASCSTGERGGVRDKHGLFAAAVADGYAGRADANANVEITAEELAAYVRARLRTDDQTPVLVQPR